MYPRILWKLVGILGSHFGKQWSSGFPTKQQLLLSLTEDAGRILSSAEECCYRTLYWLNTDMGSDLITNIRRNLVHLLNL
jgi:hypothetical protein